MQYVLKHHRHAETPCVPGDHHGDQASQAQIGTALRELSILKEGGESLAERQALHLHVIVL